MKLSEFARELGDLVEKARADLSADDVRGILQSELDNVEDDEEEDESEEDESEDKDPE